MWLDISGLGARGPLTEAGQFKRPSFVQHDCRSVGIIRLFPFSHCPLLFAQWFHAPHFKPPHARIHPLVWLINNDVKAAQTDTSLLNLQRSYLHDTKVMIRHTFRLPMIICGASQSKTFSCGLRVRPVDRSRLSGCAGGTSVHFAFLSSVISISLACLSKRFPEG